jgi:transposase
MRLGLYGQVRKRWVPKGIKPVQLVQTVYRWSYLLARVDCQGQLSWRWLKSLKAPELQQALAQWKAQGVQGVIWDGAAFHRAKSFQALNLPLLPLPPYSPELNPAERLFQEIRRAVEGKVFASLEEKIQRVDAFLEALAKDAQRVKHLVCWDWIQQALPQGPA